MPSWDGVINDPQSDAGPSGLGGGAGRRSWERRKGVKQGNWGRGDGGRKQWNEGWVGVIKREGGGGGGKGRRRGREERRKGSGRGVEEKGEGRRGREGRVMIGGEKAVAAAGHVWWWKGAGGRGKEG